MVPITYSNDYFKFNEYFKFRKGASKFSRKLQIYANKTQRCLKLKYNINIIKMLKLVQSIEGKEENNEKSY